MIRVAENGSAAFDTSSIVSVPSSASARGPISDRTQYALVTSTSAACSSSPMCRSIHAKSRVACEDPVRMRNSPGAIRVIVRSLSKPPRSFSIAVYTMRPTATSMRLAHSRSSTANASRPLSTNLENDV